MLCALKSLFTISVLGYMFLVHTPISTKTVSSKFLSKMPCLCNLGKRNYDSHNQDLSLNHCDCKNQSRLQSVTRTSSRIRHKRKIGKYAEGKSENMMMRIFLSLQGINILNSSRTEVSISTEEQHRRNLSTISAKPIKFHIGAFLTSSYSPLNIELHLQPIIGRTVIRQLSNQTLKAPNPHKCEVLLHNSDKYSIPYVSNDFNSNEYPCNFSVDSDSNSTWTSAVVDYYPSFDYHGTDRFVVNILRGSQVRPIKIKIWILANACQNGGSCWGPPSDRSCRSTERAKGFKELNYTCKCPLGWKGQLCEIKMSSYELCVRSDCKVPKQCTLHHGTYKCLCPKELIYCEPFLESWQTALLVITTGVMICLITVGLIMIARKRNSQFWDT